MNQERRLKIFLSAFSSWAVIGMSLILAVAVAMLAATNYNRERTIMGRILSEKGAALIKSFEAGARTGMMGMFGAGPGLQTLLQETASQPDILYIALVDESGVVLAHNDPEEVGRRFASPDEMKMLAPSETTQWRMVADQKSSGSFEVFKKFLPLLSRPDHPAMQWRHGSEEWCETGWMRGLPEKQIHAPNQRPIIFVGMDTTSFVSAMAEDLKLILVTSGVIFLLGLTGVVSVFWAQNYTHSRKLLQNTRAFAAEMIANLPEGIVTTGMDGKVTFINSIAAEMLGVEKFGAIGQVSEEIFPENLRELIISSGKKNGVSEAHIQLPVKDGRELPIAASATEIFTEEGNFIGFMLILRDLSQIKQLQEEVQKKEKMAIIGNLAAGVAHEVRNPLSSIKGYATFFGSLFDEGSENRRAANVMTAEVERLNRVITELMEIARPSDIRPRETDLATVLDTSLRLVRQEIEVFRIAASSSIDDDIGPLFIDPDRITQALINLYINGIQAMSEGGKLTIRARRQGESVVVSVRDTGEGIPREMIPKIFDPYYTTKKTGTGLGLAIVQKIVEAHGGSVEVESAKGSGTKFSVYLPRNANLDT